MSNVKFYPSEATLPSNNALTEVFSHSSQDGVYFVFATGTVIGPRV